MVRSGEVVACGADDIAEQFGLGVIATPSFSEDGKAIYLAYTIKNQQPQAEDTAPFVFDLAIIGDIQIGEDDSSNVTLMGNGRGFVMVSKTDVDEQGTPASLAIYYASTAGVDEPDTVWIGDYYFWDDGAYFADQRQNTQGIDSAFAVSWQGLSLAPGAQMTRSIGNALGEMAENALPAAEPTPVPAPLQATPQTVHQASLPQTSDGAVSLPVMMLIGLLALGAATSLHVSRRLRSF